MAASSLALDEDRIEVVAFVALAVSVAGCATVDTARRLEAMGRVPGVETSNFFPGHLVAQLARDDRCAHVDLDAGRLLPFAESMRQDAVASVGGRFAYLDCRDELVGYYESQDYERLYYDEGRGLHKMVKPLY